MKPWGRGVKMQCIYYVTQKRALCFRFISVGSVSLDCTYTVSFQFMRIRITKLRPRELLLWSAYPLLSTCSEKWLIPPKSSAQIQCPRIILTSRKEDEVTKLFVFPLLLRRIFLFSLFSYLLQHIKKKRLKKTQLAAQLILSIFRQTLHFSVVSRPVIRRYNRMYTTIGTYYSF
jgi:hypothetical protein